MSRKCENWLQTFAAWSLPRSEAPESYHFWAGLYTLASVVKRKIYIPKQILGGWECHPFMYIMFVAPSGRARKTTTAGYAEDLLEKIPSVERCASAITKEKLAVRLAENAESAVTIFSPEFAIFIQKSGLDMYDTLTRLFDGGKAFDDDTISSKLRIAHKPCVNLLACTTPEWLSENMTEAIIGGGFTSRVIFVVEERVRRLEIFFDDLGIDWDEMENIKNNLITDLIHISTLKGSFKLDDGARKTVREWYRKTAEEAEHANPRLGGYYQRKPAYALKIAMLLHIAEEDDLILTERDFLMAVSILDGIEGKMHKAFEHVGKNPHTSDMIKILDFIQTRGKATYSDIASNFWHTATPLRLEELLNGLVAMGKVRIYQDRDDPDNKGKRKFVATERPPDLTMMEEAARLIPVLPSPQEPEGKLSLG